MAGTSRKLAELMGRGLKELDLLALFIDGIETAEHTIVTALGVDADGHKHPLGLWEGSTENKTVCQALLNNLIERGNGGLSSRLDGASPSPGESQRPRRGRPVASQRLTLLTRRVKLRQSVLRRSVGVVFLRYSAGWLCAPGRRTITVMLTGGDPLRPGDIPDLPGQRPEPYRVPIPSGHNLCGSASAIRVVDHQVVHRRARLVVVLNHRCAEHRAHHQARQQFVAVLGLQMVHNTTSAKLSGGGQPSHSAQPVSGGLDVIPHGATATGLRECLGAPVGPDLDRPALASSMVPRPPRSP